jgi:hypothetical protein
LTLFEKKGGLPLEKPDFNAHRLAYCISSHGFGHAARAAAVMAALKRQNSRVRFEIFTQTPAWFFNDSLVGDFGYHDLQSDVGLVQLGPTREDLPATLHALDAFIASMPSQAHALARDIRRLGCSMILCDISPLGIAAASAARLPSVLIENFTWDWIYDGYAAAEARLKPVAAYFEGLFVQSSFRIQTQPVCRPQSADLTTPPVSRRPRQKAAEVRHQLGIGDHTPLLLITMGGIPMRLEFLDAVHRLKDIVFLVCGAHSPVQMRRNLILLPEHSEFFHPDLIQAADAVVGKVGYSTLAEVYQAGIPFGYIPRPAFRESDTLVAFIENHMSGLPIAQAEFYNGTWIEKVPRLLRLPRFQHSGQNGADQIASFITGLIEPMT